MKALGLWDALMCSRGPGGCMGQVERLKGEGGSMVHWVMLKCDS